MAPENEWIEWQGGKQPIADSVRVETVLRGFGQQPVCFADVVSWKHGPGSRLDVIAYRVAAA
jgi:hypothetical protein